MVLHPVHIGLRDWHHGVVQSLNVAQGVSREGTSPRSHARQYGALATEPVAAPRISCVMCTNEVTMTLDGSYGMQYSIHATLPYRCYPSCYSEDNHFMKIHQA